MKKCARPLAALVSAPFRLHRSLMRTVWPVMRATRLVLICLAAAGGADAAPAIVGSGFTHGLGLAPSNLYSISPTTGAATLIGPIGFNNVSPLAFSLNGTLYGIGNVAGSATLISINPATGAGTAIGPLGIAGVGTLADLAVRPSDGALFGMSGTSRLYTINTSTGVATQIAAGNAGNGNALAFSAGGVLYWAWATLPSAAALSTLNPSTGAVTGTTNLTYSPSFGVPLPRANGMDFDPATGILWASVESGFAGSAVHSIGQISLTTGAVSRVGATVAGLDGIAVAPATSLSVTKTGPANGVQPGGTLSYTIVVTNTGAAPALSLTAIDTLPSGVGFQNASGSGWTCAHAAGVVTCTQPALAPGGASSITITVTAPTTASVLTNSVSASASNTAAPVLATAETRVFVPHAIPTLDTYGLVLMAMALAAASLLRLRRRGSR